MMKIIESVFIAGILLCMFGCAKPQPIDNVEVLEAKDTQRLTKYNHLDNFKEGIWHVDEWKKVAQKICNDSKKRDCSVLAEIYYNDFYGYGTKRDRQKAIKILDDGCSLNDAKSCLLLANLSFSSEQPVSNAKGLLIKTYDLAREGCQMQNGFECFVLAQLYFEGYAPFSREREKAKIYAKKACAMGYASACIFLGINADTREEAQESYKNACTLGIKAHCK